LYPFVNTGDVNNQANLSKQFQQNKAYYEMHHL